ncbi:MAG: hypothetical protein DI539_19615 [Flavobacterium psychrophilum]|nr:MAG: hypothetical protein DI539_19615 [Flavobacterium psychrophilum]
MYFGGIPVLEKRFPLQLHRKVIKLLLPVYLLITTVYLSFYAVNQITALYRLFASSIQCSISFLPVWVFPSSNTTAVSEKQSA